MVREVTSGLYSMLVEEEEEEVNIGLCHLGISPPHLIKLGHECL